MRPTNDPELIGALDCYALVLHEIPELVPAIGFIVLQGIVDIQEAQKRAVLGLPIAVSDLPKEFEEVPKQYGIVTLRKVASDIAVETYSLTLISYGLTLPRRTESEFTRLGSAVKIKTGRVNEQGTPSPNADASITGLHSRLLISILQSDKLIKTIEDLQERRRQIRRVMQDPKVPKSAKKSLKEGLKHATL